MEPSNLDLTLEDPPPTEAIVIDRDRENRPGDALPEGVEQDGESVFADPRITTDLTRDPPTHDATVEFRDRVREGVRTRITYALLLLVAAVIVFAWVSVAADWLSPSDTKDVLTATLPPVITLVATAVGFYFGQESRRD